MFRPCRRHPGTGAHAWRRISLDIFCERRTRSRFRSMLRFAIAAAVVILAPAVAWYLYDPAGFVERTKTWLHAIPMGSVQFRNNMEASLLFTFVICPGAWLAFAGAGIRRPICRKAPRVPLQPGRRTQSRIPFGAFSAPRAACRDSLARCGHTDAPALRAYSPACCGDSFAHRCTAAGPRRSADLPHGRSCTCSSSAWRWLRFSQYRQMQTGKMEFARLRAGIDAADPR